MAPVELERFRAAYLHNKGRATGLTGVIRFTQVWHFDEQGLPVQVRERLDDYYLEGTRPA